MKITIKDIGRLAGVSAATVSMVLNNKGAHISKETRERILEIAKEHNYVPNTMARSLVTKKTKTIGLVIPDIANPFFPEIARGAEDRANESGYSIIFCNTDDEIEKEQRYINMLSEKMVDGIIFTASSDQNHGLYQSLRQSTPIVLLDRDLPMTQGVGKIVVNNERGAYEATSYLIQQGRKALALINGNLSNETAKSRLRGFLNAVQDAKLPLVEERILSHSFKREWGFEATNRLLAEGIPFDGVVCGNDMIAIGAIRALKEAGKEIPREVSIIGFDDIYMAKLVDPPLSTVSQPKYEMGYRASDLLISMIEGKETEENLVIFETELVIRKST